MHELLWKTVDAVCRRVPPLWDLRNYVAVNPFLGFSDQPLAQAAAVVSDGLNARVLPPVSYYRQRWADGGLDVEHVTRASRRAKLPPELLLDVLAGDRPAPMRASHGVLTHAEHHDRLHGTRWEPALIGSITRWCAAYETGGGVWGLPLKSQGLFGSWRAAAAVDRTMEIAGLKGWRKWHAALPSSAGEAIEHVLAESGLHGAPLEAYLYRLLAGVFGWASHFRRDGWSSGGANHGSLVDLLAIRVCADAAVAQLGAHTAVGATARSTTYVEDEPVRLVLQESLEDVFVENMVAEFKDPAAATGQPARPAVQAVFCIDVRSEVIRRHLEVQSPQVQTLGFAGFFGVAMDWCTDGEASARCPVLLKPAIKISAGEQRKPGVNASAAVKYTQMAPAVSFNFVETLGLAYGLKLVRDTAAKVDAQSGAESVAAFTHELPLESRVKLASGILHNMGLERGLARVVMLCGHESRTANNPHAAGLDCGACGGHGGAINARVAAAVLNDAAVRNALSLHGVEVPADTWFIPAVHNTTTDEVKLLDTASVPASHRHDMLRLESWLEQAGSGARAERATALGITGDSVCDQVRSRAADWSEVRPEWGLARNAVFIAARRQRTRGVNLAGRAFLHEYDWTQDDDNSVLTLILTAPVVVASWINLQYFASTVDNETFGCGDKTLHNRVGSVGVVIGNGGDLRTGLPMQSVHAADGTWQHEPLRLQVIVEAPKQRIEAVLEAQPSVRNLVENGWIRLFALDADSPRVSRYISAGVWEPYHAAEVTVIDDDEAGSMEVNKREGYF